MSLPLRFSLVLQALGILLVLQFFQFESQSFTLACQLFLCGAVVSWKAKDSWRLQIMVAVSIIGLYVITDPKVASVVIVLSFVAMGICMAPMAMKWKVSGLVALGIAILSWRQWGPTTALAAAAVPIFGGLFMMRTASYLKDVQETPELGGWKKTAAFFLILPNFVMWFFPLIDFRRFSRGADKPTPATYQRGMDWIFDGITHLILYRILKAVFNEPLEMVNSVGDVFAFLILNFLYYVRISGTFHIAVGLICLFGIDLPRTHDHFLFSRHFLDVSRRVNSYWKDYMAKMIYRPLATRTSATIAGVLVFASTCVIHSYVYLWGTGVFLLRLEDVLFWTFIGSLIVIDIVMEKRKKEKNLPQTRPTTEFFINWFRVTLTLFIFSVIWAIWMKDVGDLIATTWLSRWYGFQDLKPALIFPAIGFLGACWYLWNRLNPKPTTIPQVQFRLRDAGNLIALLFIVWIAKGPWPQNINPRSHQAVADVLNPNFQPEYERETRATDYYEGMKSSKVKDTDEDELPINQQPYFTPLDDYRRRAWTPNSDSMFMNHRFIANEWGMNGSTKVTLEKRPGTIRVAVLSASNSVSYGVPVDTDWPKQAELILKSKGFKNIEFLNFSVIGYSSFIFPYEFEQRVKQFNPDILVYGGGGREYYVIGLNVTHALRNGLTIPYPELFPILEISNPNSIIARHYRTEPAIEVEEKIFQWGIKKLADQAKENNIKLVYAMTPAVYLGAETDLQMRKNEEDMLRIAKENGFHTIDMSKILFGMPMNEVTLLDDERNYNHFNVRGHRLQAEKFAAEFAAYLKGLTGP